MIESFLNVHVLHNGNFIGCFVYLLKIVLKQINAKNPFEKKIILILIYSIQIKSPV